MYQYSYLIGVLSFFVIWLILFFARKDARKEMILMSILFGGAGLLMQPIFIKDWWHPLTITNTNIGIEDFFFGFVIGGIAAVIYEEFFRKQVLLKRSARLKSKRLRIITFTLLGLSLFFGTFFIFKIHSFWAFLIAAIGTTLLIWIKRKDLIINSLISGFLLTILSFLFFFIPETINPGFVSNHWYIENLTGIIILKVPLEDLIWFFMSGLIIGSLYEFWQEGRLKDV